MKVQPPCRTRQRRNNEIFRLFPSPPFSARREKPFGKSESAAVGNFVRLGRNGRGEKNWKIEGFRGRLGYLRNLHALCARKVPAASEAMFVLTRNYFLQRSHISKEGLPCSRKIRHFPHALSQLSGRGKSLNKSLFLLPSGLLIGGESSLN